MPTITIQALRDLLSLYAQKFQFLRNLSDSSGVTLAAKDSELLKFKELLAKANQEKVDAVAELVVKTQEALALATQIAALGEQYEASQTARGYAAEQVAALTGQVSEKEGLLEMAKAAAADLASLEVAEDAQQAQAQAEIESQLATLDLEIKTAIDAMSED